MVVIGDPDREWSVRPATSVGPPTGSAGASRAVAAGQRENAHLLGGRSSGVPRSAPAAATWSHPGQTRPAPTRRLPLSAFATQTTTTAPMIEITMVLKS